MQDCRIDWSVDTGSAAGLADTASYRTAPGAQSRSDHQRPLRQAAATRSRRPDPRLAAPLADFGDRVRERRSFFRPRRNAEDRRDFGAAVARTHPYRPCGRGRVRIRGPALSLAERDCGADYRGTLVGSPVLWPDQASACILLRPANEKTRNHNTAER